MSLQDLMLKTFTRAHVALYRASRGRLGARMGRAPILLLTTKGRKTGQRRTTPLLYGTDGDHLVLIASKAGAPAHPAWYLNLVADPHVEVEVKNETRRMLARTASAD